MSPTRLGAGPRPAKRETPPHIRAQEEFLARTAVPILYGVEDTAVIRGTGTLFQFLGRVFLVTASHLFDGGIDPGSIGIPIRPFGPKLKYVRPARLNRTGEDRFDAAVVEVLDEGMARELAASWNVLTREHLATPVAGADSVVAGYPSASAVSASGGITTTLVSIITSRLDSPPPDAQDPVDSDLDLFFEYRRSGPRYRGGDDDRTPDLEGISGCSVWQLGSPPSGKLWTAERQMRVVAVQTSFNHSKFIRAKSWKAVATLFGNIDEEIGGHVQAAVFEPP